MTEKPMAKARVCFRAALCMPANSMKGSRMEAKTGSPIHPNPRLARVIPTWVVLRNGLIW